MKLFDNTSIPLLGKAMDAYSLRHKAIASNVANVATAGYVAKQVRFEEELSLADSATPKLQGTTTNERHLPLGATEPALADATIEDVPNTSSSLESGANGVNIDQEMAELAKNQIRYKFSARIASETFRLLQSSIRGTTT